MTTKINVLQVIPKLGYGGAETGCYDIAHYLAEQGCQSYIATSVGADVNECETIEQQEETLDKMLKEPKYVDLAEKIKKMRSTVDNLNHFLVRKKISNYIV